MTGVSVVIPVHNGARWIDRVLAAIAAQAHDGPLEIIVVDDGSTDGSSEIARTFAARDMPISLIAGPRRGAAAALNAGIRSAVHPLIAQVDQDVVIGRGWLQRLVEALDDPSVAAAQGRYLAAHDAGLWSRVMNLDLTQRYGRLGQTTNHVCTGNTVYRASALAAIGWFDETLGYGYDNDVSYRLTEAGFRLVFCPEATSTHDWREGLMSYARQQYGFGYGRLDLIAKHRRRLGGDDVSRVAMMAHGPVMALAIALAAGAIVAAAVGYPLAIPGLAAIGLVIALGVERLVAGARAATTFHDRAGWWFAPVHFVRDAAWAAAIAMWLLRRIGGASPRPADSMPATMAQRP